MRHVWIVLLALSLSTVVYGQKSAAVRQLEQQRKEALADIEETNKLLQETAQTAKTSLNRLNLLSKQILSRKKVISLLNQELDEIEKDILNIQGQLRTLKRELGDKQTNYGKSMRGLYKRHSSQDKLLFILSAESFSQSMRRMRYLREYADWQKRQANDIVEKQAEISRKQAEMEKTRAEKRALLGTRQEESKKLESEEASQKEEVQLLNKRQKDLKADLQKKRRQAEALNRQRSRSPRRSPVPRPRRKPPVNVRNVSVVLVNKLPLRVNPYRKVKKSRSVRNVWRIRKGAMR